MSGSAVRRLLTIGHSYVVSLNRRLAHEMAVAGGAAWEVIALAPKEYRGDLGPIRLQRAASEREEVRAIRSIFQRSPHLMRYSGLHAALEGRWDVVHCWEEPYVAAGAQIARAAPREARFVVATFQNLSKRYPWPLDRFEQTTMRRADGWIAFGESVKAALEIRAGYPERPCRVIPPGVDVGAFTPDRDAGARIRRSLGWSDSARIVGYVGRFVPQKGLRTLCAALERVTGPWHAVFVGGGPLEGELREFERRHGSSVRLVTGVPHDRVPEWLNAMTLVCLPSQTTPRWREQFGRILIEAMACGVPVVASDSGEMPFVVGDAGTIVPEGNVDAWTTALERLLGDDTERRRLSAAGLDRARTRFAWPVVARAHLEFFESLIDSERATASEPGARTEPAKRRATEPVAESEGPLGSE